MEYSIVVKGLFPTKKTDHLEWLDKVRARVAKLSARYENGKVVGQKYALHFHMESELKKSKLLSQFRTKLKTLKKVPSVHIHTKAAQLQEMSASIAATPEEEPADDESLN